MVCSNFGILILDYKVDLPGTVPDDVNEMNRKCFPLNIMNEFQGFPKFKIHSQYFSSASFLYTLYNILSLYFFPDFAASNARLQ
jgi:hypothetical protein